MSVINRMLVDLDSRKAMDVDRFGASGNQPPLDLLAPIPVAGSRYGWRLLVILLVILLVLVALGLTLRGWMGGPISSLAVDKTLPLAAGTSKAADLAAIVSLSPPAAGVSAALTAADETSVSEKQPLSQDVTATAENSASTEATATEPPPDKDSAAQRPPLDLLLQQASRALRADHLTQPAAGSAWSLYQQVLALDSEQPEALQGLEQIRQRYIQLVKRDLQLGKLARATRYRALALEYGAVPEQIEWTEREMTTADTAGGFQELAEKNSTENTSRVNNSSVNDASVNASAAETVTPVVIAQPVAVSASSMINPVAAQVSANPVSGIRPALAADSPVLEAGPVIAPAIGGNGGVQVSWQSRQQLLLQQLASASPPLSLPQQEQLLKDFLVTAPQAAAAVEALFNLYLQQARMHEANVLLGHPSLGVTQQHWLVARWQVAQGDVKRALATLQTQAPVLAENPDYFSLMAGLRQQTGDFAGAATLYSELLQLRDNEPLWWLGLGIALERLQQSQQALHAYLQAQRYSHREASYADYIEQRVNALRALVTVSALEADTRLDSPFFAKG